MVCPVVYLSLRHWILLEVPANSASIPKEHHKALLSQLRVCYLPQPQRKTYKKDITLHASQYASSPSKQIKKLYTYAFQI